MIHKNLLKFPGFDEEIYRIRTFMKEALTIGNREEAERLLIEDFRELLFNQDQYLKKVYRAIEGVSQEYHNGPASELFKEYLSKLEKELDKSCEVLNSWTDDPVKIYKYLKEHIPKILKKIFRRKINNGIYICSTFATQTRQRS